MTGDDHRIPRLWINSYSPRSSTPFRTRSVSSRLSVGYARLPNLSKNWTRLRTNLSRTAPPRRWKVARDFLHVLSGCLCFVRDRGRCSCYCHPFESGLRGCRGHRNCSICRCGESYRQDAQHPKKGIAVSTHEFSKKVAMEWTEGSLGWGKLPSIEAERKLTRGLCATYVSLFS